MRVVGKILLFGSVCWLVCLSFGEEARAAPADGDIVMSDGGGDPPANTKCDTNLHWDDTNDRLGIGTATPSYPLEVYGNGADTEITVHEDAGTHEARLHLRRGANDWEIINSGDLYLEQEGTERLRVHENGLSVAGNYYVVDGNSVGAAGSNPKITFDNTNNYLEMRYCNVGIGTTSPGSLLELAKTTGDPVLTITAAHATDYDPQVKFRTDATPTVKFSMGVDGADDKFKVNSGDGIGGTSEFVIDGSGNVGIGTDTPVDLLHIYGGDSGGDPNNSARLVIEDDANAYINIVTPYDKVGGLLFGDNVRNYAGSITYNHSSDKMTFSGNGSMKMVIDSANNVGILVPNPAYRLDVGGSAAKPGGGHWTDSSDISMKRNIKTLKNALAKMLRLRGVSFKWKDPSYQPGLEGPRMGLIAQEVEEVIPEWVGTNANTGLKDMTIFGFEALTVEAIRELKAEVDSLKKNLEDANARITELESALAE